MLFAIKNLHVYGANLIMNDIVAGLPSPLAFLGFADALCRERGVTPWSARILPILHEVHVCEGRTRAEMVPKNNKFKPQEIVEDLRGHIKISMFIDLAEENSDSSIDKAIKLKTFAGGVINHLKKYSVEQIASDSLALKSIPRGRVMVPPKNSEWCYATDGHQEEDLKLLVERLILKNKDTPQGWFIPSSVGYKLLEDPSSVPERKFTRTKLLPHVFVEPLTSIAELVSVRHPRLKELDENEFLSLFWHWNVRSDYMLGHSNYYI